jgi:biopolymer transport protein ExbD
MRRVRRSQKLRQEAELDITAFMNLMIVLVPVLLLGMVFSQITVLDITLPDASSSEAADSLDKKKVELLIRQDSMSVNYPQGIELKKIPMIIPPATAQLDTTVDQSVEALEEQVPVHDFKMLTLVLQEIKRQLREKNIENKSITILSEPTTSYQSIVSAMDTVRSYKAVVAATVVDAELFPEVSFGDAPILAQGDSQ